MQNQLWQYEPIVIPADATPEQKKSWQRLSDIFDDIYHKYGRMNPNMIGQNAIGASNIIDNSINSQKIANSSVSTEKLTFDVGENLDISSNMSIVNKVEKEDLEEEIKELGVFVGSSIEQSETAIIKRINTVNNVVVDIDGRLEEFKQVISIWQRFTELGLQLGRTDSAFSTLISNTRISFLQDGSEVAFISNNKMYITLAQIEDVLTIGTEANGYFDFIVDSEGLGLMYRG